MAKAAASDRFFDVVGTTRAFVHSLEENAARRPRACVPEAGRVWHEVINSLDLACACESPQQSAHPHNTFENFFGQTQVESSPRAVVFYSESQDARCSLDKVPIC